MLGRWISSALGRLTANRPEEVTAAPMNPEQRLIALREVDLALKENELELARVKLIPLLEANQEDHEALAAAGFTAYLSGSPAEAHVLLEKAVRLDPANAQAVKFLAAALFQLGEDRPALHFALKAAELSPKDNTVMNLLGVLYMNLEFYDEAADQFHKALEVAPNNLIPLVNLAQLDTLGRVHRRKDDLRPRTEHIKNQALNRLLALQRRSQLSIEDAKFLLALTSTSMKHFDVAKKVADDLYERSAAAQNVEVAKLMAKVYTILGDLRKSIEMNELIVLGKPLENGPKQGLAHLLIAEGGERWLEGWRLTNEEFPKLHQSAFVTEVPRWDGKALGKNRLFVYQDQGYGDVLLCLRFLSMLAAMKIRVVLWVRPGIADLARTVPGYEEFLSSEARPDPRTLNCSAAVPLFGLPGVLKIQRRDLKQAPVVKPDPALCTEWRGRLGLRKKVSIGLAAMGNPWRYDDWMRSVPSSALAPLKRIKDVGWVNLSVDDRPDLSESISLLEMSNPAMEFRSFSDTAAAISALDAVVAIDCSVAHLAAALGKPVWVLAPSSIEWRWRIGSDTSPWWPNAISLHSPRPGDWSDPIAQLVSQLENFVASRGAKVAEGRP